MTNIISNIQVKFIVDTCANSTTVLVAISFPNKNPPRKCWK